MKRLSDDFMKNFRWITPLLLFFLNIIVGMIVYAGSTVMDDFKEMRKDVVSLKVDVATIKGKLERK